MLWKNHPSISTVIQQIQLEGNYPLFSSFELQIHHHSHVLQECVYVSSRSGVKNSVVNQLGIVEA